MVHYRQAEINDLEWTYAIKEDASRHLVEQLWGRDPVVQQAYHQRQFDPDRTKLILYQNEAVGYIAAIHHGPVLFIENIMIATYYQGKGIGTQVLADTIRQALQQGQAMELQVLKINDRAKRLYERSGFVSFAETALHYKMRYRQRTGLAEVRELVFRLPTTTAD